MDAILARTGVATLQAITALSKGDPKQVMEELARHHLIKPIVTQGHTRRTARQNRLRRPDHLRRFRWPLFNDQGEVIGINFAMVRDFGESNFAIPVRFGESLVKPEREFANAWCRP
jgi:hypothetical protein